MSATTRPYRQVARAAATEETRRRLVAAFAAAIGRSWMEEITLDEVAAAAGTTRQTAIRLFGGKEGLLAAVTERIGREVVLRRSLPPGAGARAVARAVVQDYEASGDMVMRLLAQEGRYPPMAALLDTGRAWHRRWVAEAFAQALSALPPPRREVLLDQLVVATDVFTWKLLRRDRRRTAAEVEEMVASLIIGILQQERQRDA
ncbi:TetR/AcrR family transcriptional regulator [Falsiroseomonas sp.]|uniref:TetR/AcrR family transcriptional regulator n=1 Tax=Falsiroseomonas sp. TaxID=2870721 RepID=UPI00356AA21F